MNELKLKIEPEDIAAILKDALMVHLTEGKRDELIKEALAGLLKGNWNNPSQMQQAFSMGASNAIHQIVREEMLKPERAAQLQALFVEAWSKMFDKDVRDELTTKIADQMRKGLTGERY